MKLFGSFSPHLEKGDLDVIIQFDGALHNRAELQKIFGDLSDSDLTRAAYRQWGENCAEYLDGEFAFAILDYRSDTLFAVRDKLGIKPFYYFTRSSTLHFGSDLTQLARHPDFERSPDEEALAFYFFNDWSEQSQTFYKNLRRLAPAHVLSYSRQGLRTSRYWEFNPGPIEDHRSLGDLAEEFRHTLLTAVEKRHPASRNRHGVASQARIGLLLSGGLDSSSVAAAMHHQSLPFESFSLTFDAPDASDRGIIAQTRSLGDWPHHEFRPEDVNSWTDYDFTASFEDLDYSPCFFFFKPMLERARARGIKTLFTGDGGDELLTPAASYLADLLRNFELHAFWNESAHASARPEQRLRTAAIEAARALVPRPLVRGLRKTVKPGPIPRFLNPRFERRFDVRSRIEQRYREAFDRFKETHRATRYLRLFTWGGYSRAFEQQELLAQRYEVEFSYPLFDVDLIELAFRTPLKHLTCGGARKIILREAMRGVLPEPVRTAPYLQDYTTISRTALLRQWSLIQSWLNDSRLVEMKIVRPDRLQEFVSDAMARDDHNAILALANTEKWLRTF